jgi:hypothetical protein
MSTCFVDLLRQRRDTINSADPWLEILQAIRGHVGAEGVERISTENLYDALSTPRFQRTPEASKRLKALMQGLGWTPVRARLFTSRGNLARARGYARICLNMDRQRR